MKVRSQASALNPEMGPYPGRSEGPYRLQSLDRAVAVLQVLGDSDSPLSLSELCQIMSIHKSTAHRSLMALERSLLIERTQDNRYCLGMKLYEWGHRAVEQADLRTRVSPYLRRLASRLRETVHLGILQGESVIYLDKLDPNRRVCMSSKIGTHNPVYCTALGKAILAFLPKEAVAATISRIQFVRFTEKTLASGEDLMLSLERIRKRGYSIDDEEIELGVRCVGAPVFDESGFPIAAISVSDLSPRIRVQNLHTIAVQLMRCSAEISASLRSSSRRKVRVVPIYAPAEDASEIALQ